MKNQTAALLVTCFTQPRIPNNNRRVLKNQITCRENGIKFAFILYRIYYWRWYYRGRWFPDVTNYESFVISDSKKNLAYRCYHNTIYITHSSVRISLLVKVNEEKRIEQKLKIWGKWLNDFWDSVSPTSRETFDH